MSSCCVTYAIVEQDDGQLDITVTGTTGFTVQRCNLASYADAHEALEDLQMILAVQNLHLVQIGGPALA